MIGILAQEAYRVESFNHPGGNPGVELSSCGFEKCFPGFISHSHTRDCYLIYYVSEGEGFFRQDNTTYPIRPGCVFAVFPGHVAACTSPNKQKPWSFCWFGFRGRNAAELLESTGVTLVDPVFQLDAVKDFVSVIESCSAIVKSQNSGSDSLLQSYLHRLLFILANSLRKSRLQLPANSRAAQYVNDVLSFIHYNYMERITVQDLSNYLNIDRSYLWKIFNQQTGSSPQQYLMQYRINKAAELLRGTSLQLSEIAVCVGIPDIYYFSRLFKNLKGLPPIKYKTCANG